MPYRGIYILILLCLTCLKSFGQDDPALLFRHLNAEKGLSANYIYCMYRDNHGYLWISTENGLTRFDGLTCKVYRNNPKDSNSIAGNFCNNIIEDKNGDLWIGTQNALSRYNRLTDNFSTLSFQNSKKASRQYVFPFFIDNKNRMWMYLGLSGSVFNYDLKTKQLDSVSSYSNGHIFSTQPLYTELRYYISRDVKGIYITYLNNSKATQTKGFFLNNNSKHQPVSFINKAFKEDDTTIWLCGDIGLIELNPAKETYTVYNKYKGETISAVTINEYNDDNFFIGTGDNGLLMFDRRTRAFVGQYINQLYNDQSLAGNTITYSLLDKQRNLFIASADHGISYANIRQAVFTKYLYKETTASDHADNNILSLLPFNSAQIWCGTKTGGIIVYDWVNRKITDRYTTSNTPSLFSNNIQQIIQLKNGDILIDCQTGFTLFERRSGRFTKLAFSSTEINAVKPAIHKIQYLKDSTLIAVTEDGLFEINIADNKIINFKSIDAINNNIEWNHTCFMYELSNSVLLVQTYYTSLYAFEKKNGEYRLLKNIGSTPFKIYNLALENETAYMATSAGLKTLNIKKLQLDEDKTLIDAPCNDIAAAGNQYLWITTSSGLYRYNYYLNTFSRFTKNEGLQDNLFNPNTIVRVDGNKLAVAGVNGFNLFDPQYIHEAYNKYILQVDNILVNDKVYSQVPNPGLLKKLVLPFNQNTISLSFTTIGFINPESNVIYYQLKNYDNFRIKALGKGNIRYAQLPHGSYQFLLYNGNDLRKPARIIDIIITPPLWQLWWFKAILIIIVAAIIYLLIRMRINSIKQRQLERVQIMIQSQEDERRRIARDLHDDFGGRLSTLKLYMQAAQKDNGSQEALLSQSSQMIDQAIAGLRNILLNLSPKTLEENGFQAMLQEIADHINSSRLLVCEVDTAGFTGKLNQSAAIALYRICQELINNTIKYAKAKHIYITMVSRSDKLLFLYEDDGMGFNLSSVKRGYGITNIETHVQALRGELFIDPVINKGTAVTIELPLFHFKSKP
jgi:signal transduction histidine kinase/ligand-binding sensor domain-containing protein